MIDDEVKKAFADVGIIVSDIKILRYDKGAFGDFVAEVVCSGGAIRIIRDRGQYFVDIKNNHTMKYEDISLHFPEVLPLYEKGKWSLVDLLGLLAKRSLQGE